LCVCTDNYNKRVDEGKGGAGYEGCLITAELIRDSSTDKFIPIIRNVTGTQKTPSALMGEIVLTSVTGSGMRTNLKDF